MTTIYFIQAGDSSGPVKIGQTRNLTRRLREMQSHCPLPLRIIRSIEDDQSAESRWHDHYGRLRLSGEWFTYCPTMLSQTYPFGSSLKKNTRSESVSFRCYSEDIGAIEQLAKQEKISRTRALEHIIDWWRARYDQRAA